MVGISGSDTVLFFELAVLCALFQVLALFAQHPTPRYLFEPMLACAAAILTGLQICIQISAKYVPEEFFWGLLWGFLIIIALKTYF